MTKHKFTSRVFKVLKQIIKKYRVIPADFCLFFGLGVLKIRFFEKSVLRCRNGKNSSDLYEIQFSLLFMKSAAFLLTTLLLPFPRRTGTVNILPVMEAGDPGSLSVSPQTLIHKPAISRRETNVPHPDQLVPELS